MGRHFAGRAVALAAGVWLGAAALPLKPAGAIDVALPGERKLEVIGFYELRIRSFGEDLPANGMSLSQFRHVLNVETELDILPEGGGPFDFMLLYTRWVVSYECVYRRDCGLFGSTDVYGGSKREAVRHSQHFKPGKTRPFLAGGVEPVPFHFDSLVPEAGRHLNPGRRYRGCVNPEGVFSNPWPLSIFCNWNDDTTLDPPIDLFVDPALEPGVRTRAGVVNPRVAKQLLSAAREGLGEARFAVLDGLPLLDDQFGELNGVARAARAIALRDPDRADEMRVFLSGLVSRDGVPYADTLNGLGFDPDDPNTVTRAVAFSELLAQRPDVERFGVLSRANGHDLTAALWASSQYHDSSIAWLADIDTPIRPGGYFRVPADTVHELAFGMGAKEAVVLGGKTDPVLGRELSTAELAGKPFFIGPDGVSNTADDLPIRMCPPGTTPETMNFGSGPERFAGSRCIPDGSAVSDCGPDQSLCDEPLYYLVGDPNTPNPTRLLDLSGQSPDQAAATCRAAVSFDEGGLNMNGECISLSTDRRVGPFNAPVPPVTVAAKAFLQDPSFRPAAAVLEPTNLTDLRLRARGGGLPARPPAPGGGTYYTTAGLRKLQQSAHGLISGLDIDFTEDELRWEHGAGADEHEFREGYVELEFMDSVVFMRLGKLVMIWGKTELFRNQDRLNPTDLGLGTLPSLEESRMGQWAALVTISPEWAMQVGRFEDLSLELVVLFDDFEPTDLGKCGESLTFDQVCDLSFGTMATGLTGIGAVGAVRPDQNYGGLKRFDYGIRIQGRLERFTFSISDFWGWDDDFYLDVVHQYGRRVDPDTGAPVNYLGALSCTHRTDTAGNRLGPDGDASTLSDNDIPTVGNCLLWDNPGTADPNDPGCTPADGLACQFVRASDDIAFNHSANQTLFHTACSLMFDADLGQCELDRLNDLDLFDATAGVLSGEGTAVISPVRGYETVRLTSTDPNQFLVEVGKGVLLTDEPSLFARTTSFGAGTPDFSQQLNDAQKALLGCGSAFATSCGPNDSLPLLPAGSAYRKALGLSDDVAISGGVDLLNADASVILQEFTILKANQGGALVGTRNQRFEAGITHLEITASEAAAAGVEATLAERNRFLASKYAEDDPRHSLAGFRELIAQPPGDPGGNLAKELNLSATDFQIEPTRWIRDPSQVALTFRPPDVGPDGIVGTFDDDYFEPPHAPDEHTLLEEFTVEHDLGNPGGTINRLGENCLKMFGGPEPGCTVLEIVSGNLERFLIATDIIGEDTVFDPPETFAELLAMLDGDDRNALFGDPIAGEDGIVFNDFDANKDGRISHDDLATDQKAISGINGLVVDRLEDCPASADFCFKNLGSPLASSPLQLTLADPHLIGALPLGMRLAVGKRDVTFADDPRRIVPIQRLSPFELQQLEAFDEVRVEGSKIGEPAGPVTLFRTFIDRTRPTPIVRALGSLLELDQDRRPTDEFVKDLDQDGDKTLDFVDDGLPGPVSDDNILCGSGIPGDVLQDAQQINFGNDAGLRPNEELRELHESGLDQGEPAHAPGTEHMRPFTGVFAIARSPVFCESMSTILEASGQTLPFVKAGGDGTFGRRDFLWHGGRQLALNYQKKNVFAFAFDFAEDRSKTSWGIEFSWMSKKLIGNNLRFDGLSRSSELLLSVSVDRPTFFNFLNPNRSFFVNFQFFLRYIPNYKGAPHNKDGMFGVAERSFTPGFVTLTVFTGYFQDRLNPRFTFVWDPSTSTYGILSGIGYRWNAAFSTSFGLNHFFGHYTQTREGLFPVVLLRSIDAVDFTQEARPGSVAIRGLGAVRNRDSATLIVRYTF